MPRAVRRGACSALMFIAVLCCGEAAPAKPIRLFVFDLNADHSYQVLLNGNTIATPFSGASGSIAVNADAPAGAVVSIIDDGNPDLQPPLPPLFTSLDPGDTGCARATWIASGDPTVVGYVVSFGRNSVAGGAAQYDESREVASSSLEVCSLVPGTHYFSVQSRNYAGMLSAYSAERSVNIIVVSVLIAGFDARIVDGGVALSWRVEADERILGFRVYRRDGDGVERALAPDLIAPEERSFVDRAARAGASYSYVVAAVNESREETRSFAVSVEVPRATLALGQNVPNPFNPATTIPFVLAEASRVVLRVYDVRGALVATLFDGALAEGRHVLGWDGRNDAGRMVSSGTYVYSLVAGKQRLSRKMLMVR